MRVQRDPRRYSEAACEEEDLWPDDVGPGDSWSGLVVRSG